MWTTLSKNSTTDIYKTLYTTIAEYTFFSSALKLLPR